MSSDEQAQLLALRRATGTARAGGTVTPVGAEQSQPTPASPEVPPRLQGSAQMWGPPALCRLSERVQGSEGRGEARGGPRAPPEGRSLLCGAQGAQAVVLQACPSAHLGLPGLRCLFCPGKGTGGHKRAALEALRAGQEVQIGAQGQPHVGTRL